MARTNKYSSLNFNDIYEKKITSTSPSSLASPSKSPSSSSLSSAHKSYSFSASRLGHGGMLVLSRPSPKAAAPSPSPPLSPSPHLPYPSLATPPSTPPTKSSDSDSISLRPQGKTGSGPTPNPSPFPVLERENKEASMVPKSDKFVPPHLRPGYVAREQNPVPPYLQRSVPPRPGNYRPGSGHGYHGPRNRYGEDGRPKSGGGYDLKIRGVGASAGDSDLVDFNRPRSGGNRPSSSGWG